MDNETAKKQRNYSKAAQARLKAARIALLNTESVELHHFTELFQACTPFGSVHARIVVSHGRLLELDMAQNITGLAPVDHMTAGKKVYFNTGEQKAPEVFELLNASINMSSKQRQINLVAA